ncbi:CAMK/CAMKL/GIN4 protein kinase Cdr1 [Schizosaccharomyces cryophilus OY26]|uniref:CAMK/CAMKL/GIN4 protein kinase Cdr1 n=1 Tax=Schizosaccharomyces cryophilus (strain OY26 / ATCC MYA-4695 / CBS 11777 / NBRC 106824 / NRRL Y48691) TaxID=653667 RepID=S9VXX9_SCHCR|nr:CAMK/CAMKL/GIN4 protein kinase Cdr1 [Schizosaccharomyces cryophilus OY26]EPY52453.1 CAMK/CAMKL/GIN4 protein kinase Cdr1 [Schizosaccharomyces cryophilus OY26]
MVKRHKNTIGLWRLGKTLGSGSTSCVRLAKHVKTGNLAAVKILPIKYVSVGMEILMMRLLHHPNILQLYDVWTDHQNMYLALEYVPGGELFDYVRKHGALPEKEVAHYLIQLLDALSHCHQFRFRHRDLKLENILINPYERVLKIADFGMATVEPDDSYLTNFCGSLHYLAPEIVSHTPYQGAPADIWSCGVIFYALLSNKLPFGGISTDVVYDKILSGTYDLPCSCSTIAQDLLHRMLDVNPSTRITIPEIFNHPYIQSNLKQPCELRLPKSSTPYSILDVEPLVVDCMCLLWKKKSSKSIVAKLQMHEDNDEKRVYHALSKCLEDDMRKKRLFDKNKYLSLYDLIHDKSLFMKLNGTTFQENALKECEKDDSCSKGNSNRAGNNTPFYPTSDSNQRNTEQKSLSGFEHVEDNSNLMYKNAPPSYEYYDPNSTPDPIEVRLLSNSALEQEEYYPYNRYGYTRIFPNVSFYNTNVGYETPSPISTPDSSLDVMPAVDDSNFTLALCPSVKIPGRPISLSMQGKRHFSSVNARSASVPLCNSRTSTQRCGSSNAQLTHPLARTDTSSIFRKLSAFFLFQKKPNSINN